MRADDLRRDARTYMLEPLREVISDLSDVVPLTAKDDFRFSTATLATDKALLTDSFGTGLEYNRTARHIARGGIDHYQVAFCMQGKMQFSSGRRELTMRPGDIWLVDMAEPSRTWLGHTDDSHARVMALVLPRAVLAPLLAHPDSTTASFISGQERHARLLTSQFAALWRPAASEPVNPTAAIEAMTDIVAAAIGGTAAVKGNAGRAERHLHLAMIKRHIDANLETDLLTSDHLCGRFGISRASLYRLFEADGGLLRYVQQQRLNRALRRLINPAPRGNRVIDLATDLRFSSESTFIRAFRRHFGLPPGEVKELSGAWLRKTEAASGPDGLFHHLAGRRRIVGSG
jgi:AraC-like DNA-binding protein